MIQIAVSLLPGHLPPNSLPGSTAVVIDVLRASTTIVHALAAGARAVVPCAELDEARRVAQELGPAERLLGGERGGLPIAGFDLGNSPGEYTRQRVANRLVIFTTTNGTRALAACRAARQVLVAAPVNAAAVIRRLSGEPRVHLVCAGTDGRITREDVLFAGLLVVRLSGVAAAARGADVELNDEAVLARDVFRAVAPAPEGLLPAANDGSGAVSYHLARSAAPADTARSAEQTSAAGTVPCAPAWLVAALTESCGGRNLVELGLSADIDDAARLDRFDLVPLWDAARGWLVRCDVA